MSVPEKRVLAQDMPQYEQSVKAKRVAQAKKEQKEYDAALKQYEIDVAKYEQEQKEAEEKYQKELADYNKQLAEYEKSQEKQKDHEAGLKSFDEKIRALEEEKTRLISNIPKTKRVRQGDKWVEVPMSRQERADKINKIIKNISSDIKLVERQKKGFAQRSAFNILYPDAVIQPSVLRTWRENLSSSKAPSLTSLYERDIYNRALSLESAKRSGAQTARAVAAKQKAEMSYIGTKQTSYGLDEGAARAAAIKPTQMPSNTIFPKMPMQAEKTRRPMINVDTGQSIMGGQKASPEVAIKTLENRYQVQTAGGTKTFKTKETAERYLEKKQISVPIKPVLREVTRKIPAKAESRGAPLLANPLAKLAGLTKPVPVEGSYKKPIQGQEGFRTIYSFENISDVKDPSAITLLQFQEGLKTRTAPSQTVYAGILEERGLPMTPLAKRIIDVYSSKGLYRNYKEPVAAKGKKGIIKQDGKQIFDLGTGMGDVRIGKEFGFVYDYNLQRPSTEQPKTFEGTLQYALSPKVQGPPKPRYEEVVAVSGSLEYAVGQQTKPTPFNKLVESQYNKLGELQEVTAKRAKGGNLKDILVQIGYAPSEAVRSVLGAGSTIVNLSEQYVDPFVQEKLGLKRTVKPEPINLKSEVAGTTVLPYQFEQGRFDTSFEEYAGRQRQTIERIGVPAYAFGVGFDYFGLKGLPQTTKGGLKIGEKIIGRFVRPGTKLAEREGIAISTGGKRLSLPSKMWDATTTTEKGIKRKQKTPDLYGKITTQKPEPNPFGKERRMPYAISQTQKKMSGVVEDIKTKGVGIGRKAKTVIQRDITFPNRSIIESRNKPIPNITKPAKPEFSKNLESIRIGLEIKKSELAKKLSEMSNVYRAPIEPSYGRIRTSVGFGVRIKTKKISQYIGKIKQPELKGILKIKKEISFARKRTVIGIIERRKKLYKTLTGLKPSLKIPYSAKRTSFEIARFKQREKLSESLLRMKKITDIQETPKAVVEIPSKNRLRRLKSMIGVQEPWDFKSIVKPFQRLDIRKEFPSGIRGGTIGKIKGTTSRKEFARLLTESDTVPIASPLIKAKRNLLPEGSYDIEKKVLLSDIGKIRRKGIDIISRKERTVKALKGSLKTPDTKMEMLKSDLSRIGVQKKPERFVPKYSQIDLPATSPDYSFKKILKDIGQVRRKGLDYIAYREMELKALRGSLKTPDTKFELVQKDISKITSKSKRIARLKNIDDLKAPTQTIKPIFPVPRKPTELENILEGFKKEKPKNIVYKRVTIDKYIPKTPKSWESWKAVGIVTTAGTLSMLGLGEQQKAEALPYTQLGKIATRQIESGRQILIYPEIKSSRGIPSLVPPTPKTIQREEEKKDEKTKLKLITYPKLSTAQTPKLSIEISQPQKIQESFKMETVQTPKITVTQRLTSRPKVASVTRSRYRAQAKTGYETIQVPKLRQAQVSVPKLASPLAPRQPARLAQPPKFKKTTKQTFRYAEPTPRRPARRMALIFPDKDIKIPKSVLQKQKERADFLGASSELQISGVFKRQDITYGQKKISRLLKGDVRVVQGKKRTVRTTRGKKDLFGFPKKKKVSFW